MATQSSASRTGRGRPRPPSQVAAVDQAIQANAIGLHLPWVGRVTLPPPDQLIWYAAVGMLAAIEMIEPPVALVLAVGKALADNRSHRTLRSMGEAMEEAG